MTFALQELSALLSPQKQVMGVVVRTGAQARVATRNGSVTATPVGILSVGDRVVISGGLASKAPVPSTSFAV